MRRVTTITASLITALTLAGCANVNVTVKTDNAASDQGNTTVIGGSDGPTSIYLAPDTDKEEYVDKADEFLAGTWYIAGYKIATCSIIVPGAGEGGSSSSGGGSVVPPSSDTSIDPTTSGGSDTSVVPPDPGDDDEDDGKECTVYFFIDYNNIDENDKTGTKLLAKFKWYGDRPISESGLVPSNPTQAMDPAFPYFIGWSNHTIIDTKDDLWNMTSDVIGNGYYFYLYGIWSDVSVGEFTR